MLPFENMQLPLGVPEIQECIPHRYPFLLIDKIIALTPYQSITAIKNVSALDPFMPGHFPNYPVFPGVLIVEGIAQASAVLGYCSTGKKNEVLLTEVNQTRFRKKVLPGDTLRYDIVIEKHRNPFFWFKGTAYVDQEIVATTSFSALLK